MFSAVPPWAVASVGEEHHLAFEQRFGCAGIRDVATTNALRDQDGVTVGTDPTHGYTLLAANAVPSRRKFRP